MPKKLSSTMLVSCARQNASEETGNVRTPLSRSLILRTALTIIDADGLTGLTIRKLSSHLGVTAMAVYRYFKNKAAIEHELVDLVVGDHDVLDHHETDWVEWVCVTYTEMRRALCAHPGVMPLLDNASYQGGNALTVMDRILAHLRQAGLSDERSAHLFHTLMAHMIGTVVLMNANARQAIATGNSRHEAHSKKKNDIVTLHHDNKPHRLSVEMVSLRPYPNIAGLARHLIQIDDDQHFMDSVRQITRAMAVG